MAIKREGRLWFADAGERARAERTAILLATISQKKATPRLVQKIATIISTDYTTGMREAKPIKVRISREIIRDYGNCMIDS